MMPNSVNPSRYLITGGSGFIGSHLMSLLNSRPDIVAINFDRAPPASSSEGTWICGDVRDQIKVRSVLKQFHPTHVVHLAARVDIDGKTLEEYRTNTEGSANLLSAIADTTTVRRVLLVSTQYVCEPGYEPVDDEDYSPHTSYGESKVIAEKMLRNSRLGTEWTIVRPTTIWGPGDLSYRSQFYKVLDRGLYMHPARRACIRSFGYVGNAVNQIHKLAEADSAIADRATFYVGDPPVEVIQFANEFSQQLRGRGVKTIPASIIRGLGFLGDALTTLNIPFPITSRRYRSMVEEYTVPIERTIELLGSGPYTLSQGVAQTIRYLEEVGLVRPRD